MKLTALALVTVGLSLQTAVPSPTELIVREPTDQTVLRRASRFAADVQPASVSVRHVAFYVDGQMVCQIAERPFECKWDAGPASTARTIRVVAQLADGSRVSKAFRTAESTETVFRGGTDAILVPVRVLDASDRFRSGLMKDDFEILEDGIPQEISFVLVENAPATILLALDISGSMNAQMESIREGALTFLKVVPPTDLVSLAVFNEDLFVLSKPSGDRRPARNALERLKSWGSTALYDGIIRGAELLQSQPSPRAMVVFTDGNDSSSRSTMSTVRSALQSRDLSLYIVAAPGAAKEQAIRELETVSRETGGSFWRAPRVDELPEQFAAIGRELATRYVLGYTPRIPLGDGKWRRIEVKLKKRSGDHEIHARVGYLATPRENGR
jgi:Ca-activated chloride channel family protein